LGGLVRVYPESVHDAIIIHKEKRKMTEPVITQKAPFGVEVEAGKSYYWCACGKSATQPFCDGSHKGSGISPMKYEATETKKVYFCGCRHSHNLPLCDGTHKSL
jgi:CDGSH-type Zn-finger protein